MTTTERLIIGYEQYRGLQSFVLLPSPKELFEFQRATLAEKKLAPVEMFDRFADRLPSGLFILVPPQPAAVDTLDWNELMARVELGSKTGRNCLDPKYLADEIEVPAVPTMLTSVEDGDERRCIHSMDSRKAIAQEGRHPYTMWRGYIHVVLFTEVLKHHYLDCVGSLYEAKHAPPFFCLDDDEPSLHSFPRSYAHPDWGAPSCGSVEA